MRKIPAKTQSYKDAKGNEGSARNGIVGRLTAHDLVSQNIP